MKNKIESESKESKNDDVLGHIPIDAIYDPSMRTIVDEGKPMSVAAIIREGQTRYYSQNNLVMQTEYSTSPEFYERVGLHLHTEYWKPVFERKKGDVRILVFGDGAGTLLSQSFYAISKEDRRRVHLTIVEPIPHLLSQQIQKAGYYVGKSQITAIQDSIESYMQTSRECFDIIQSNEVLDALDFVPLRNHHDTIQELYAVPYNSHLIFVWDTPQKHYQDFIEEFSSYITQRPCIYQPDVFFVVRTLIDRLSPEGSCILVDYYTHGPTPIERMLNVGRNIHQKLGMPQNTPNEVYRSEGLIAAIQGLGLVDTTIRVDRNPILRACQKANVQIEIKNQWLQHVSSAESILQRLRLFLLPHLANFSIVHIRKS